jgi:hypothetical protein
MIQRLVIIGASVNSSSPLGTIVARSRSLNYLLGSRLWGLSSVVVLQLSPGLCEHLGYR